MPGKGPDGSSYNLHFEGVERQYASLPRYSSKHPSNGEGRQPTADVSFNMRDYSALLSCHLLLLIYCHFIPVLLIWTFEFLKNRSLIEHISKSHDPQVENMTLRELALQEL